MKLVRDLLDGRMVDRHGRPLGRVDGLVLEQPDGAPPRVVCFESGLVTLARRLHPRLARWMRAVERRLGVSEGDPVRFPIQALRDVGVDVKLDVAAGETGARRWEKWLRKHVVGRIPGSGAR
jgi:hypothetical protein